MDAGESPETASYLGLPGHDDRWNDDSLAALTRRHADRIAFADRAAAIDASQLNDTAALNLTLFRRDLAVQIAEWNTGWHLLPISAREGIQDAAASPTRLPFETVKHYDDWLTRINAFGDKDGRHAGAAVRGRHTGRTHPRVVMSRLPAADSRPDRARIPPRACSISRSATCPGSRRRTPTKLRAAAKIGIAQTVVPGVRADAGLLRRRLSARLLRPRRLWQWPEMVAKDRVRTARVRFWDGPRCYAHFCRKFTTTDATPDEIHAVGLSEVARIRGEMLKIKEEVGFDGDLQAFFTHLRTDPKFFYGTAAELMDGYRELIRTVDPELPELFGTLPADALRRAGDPRPHRPGHHDGLLPRAQRRLHPARHVLREHSISRRAARSGRWPPSACTRRSPDITCRSPAASN